VRDAIELLGADRVDHGGRAIDGPQRGRPAGRHEIPLGRVSDIEPHARRLPLHRAASDRALRRAGVAVSVNTDDPALLGTRLVREYALCRDALPGRTEEVRAVRRTSIDASFSDEDRQAAAAAMPWVVG